MVEGGLPDLSPAALGRLIVGMTKDEVLAIVGSFHRPNLHEGREYYAWIGEGGMLRAYFDGPGKTLSTAVLDMPQEQRRLDLGSDAKRRFRQATIMQMWYCVECRKRYRQPQTGRPVLCAKCGGECERPIHGIRVPAPRYARAWDMFWAKYRAESELLDAFTNGELRETVQLELFGFKLPKNRRNNSCT